MATASSAPEQSPRQRLAEVALLFLKLGATAFGGPAAHIAMMRDEVVRRRKGVDEQRFLDLLGAVNLIPGPNSTEMTIHLGHLRAGWPGLIVGGACFIASCKFIGDDLPLRGSLLGEPQLFPLLVEFHHF
jgi:chromate transporter